MEGSPESQKRWGMEAAYSRVSGNQGFFVSAFRNLVDQQIITGASVGFRAQVGSWPVLATFIGTSDFNAAGVTALRTYGSWTISLDGRLDDAGTSHDLSYTAVGAVAYHFGKNSAKLSVQARDDGHLTSAQYYMNEPSGRLSASIGAEYASNDMPQEDEGRPIGSLSFNDSWIEADFSSESDQRGQTVNSGIIAGGIAFFDGQLLPMRRVFPNSAIAVAKAGVTPATVDFDGVSVRANSNGYAAAPVWAWHDARVGLAPNSLPEGWSSGDGAQHALGRAGSFVPVELKVERPGFFMKIPGAGRQTIKVGAVEVEHFPGAGAYITASPGRTTVEIGGRIIEVDLPDVGIDVPTLTLGPDGQLRSSP